MNSYAEINKANNTPKTTNKFFGNNSFIQPKLTINVPNDAYEQEADAVADKVMRMEIPSIQPKAENNLFFKPISINPVQRKCAHCEKEEKKMQRKEMNTKETTADDSLENYVGTLSSSGTPLPNEVRSFYEPRFGYDFSNVKVHTDRVAAKSAQSINALAYTSGNNIVFNNGQYATTDSGKRLLGHELTHVVQQANGIVSKQIQRAVIDRNVTTNDAILRQLGLTRQEVIDAITAADADAVILAQAAEDMLTTQLANAQNGDPVDPDAELILNEELGLSYNNAAQRGLIREQIGRFRRIRETLESGYLRYLGLGIGNIPLVGCSAGDCGTNFAFSCPGNRLIVLCQAFWDNPDQQSATVLHEPFHIWFSMLRHAPNALRRADASCFESFAVRAAGRTAFASCVAHTGG